MKQRNVSISVAVSSESDVLGSGGLKEDELLCSLTALSHGEVSPGDPIERVLTIVLVEPIVVVVEDESHEVEGDWLEQLNV